MDVFFVEILNWMQYLQFANRLGSSSSLGTKIWDDCGLLCYEDFCIFFVMKLV